MTLDELNRLPEQAVIEELMRCCGSLEWARRLGARRPFQDLEGLLREAEEAWAALSKQDWLEAFSHHPRIGGADALRAKFAATRQWAQGEQAKVAEAPEQTIQELARGNEEYERIFGHIFIVCASGKSADEMLALLRARLSNDARTELKLAAAEQAKITRIRLEKLLAS